MRTGSGVARGERRFGTALGIAVALHAGIAWIARRGTPSEASRVAQAPYFDISFVPEDARAQVFEEDAPPQSERAEPTEPHTQRLATWSEPRAAAAPPGEPQQVGEEPPSTPAAGSAEPGASAAEPGLSLSALGIGGENPFVTMPGRGAELPAAPPTGQATGEAPDRFSKAEKRLNQTLVAGALEHDRAVGLSRAGAVVEALRESAMLVASPVNGFAEFVATIDATGVIVSLQPARVSSNAAEWRNVALHALKKLSKTRLRVPPSTSGLEVRLALSSKNQLPSGSTGSGVKYHTDPLFERDGTLARQRPTPGSEQVPPPALQESPSAANVPLVRQHVPAVGVDGDLSDIGGVSRRIVSVRIVSERPL